MAVPWLKILNGILGVSDVVRVVKNRAAPPDQLSVGGAAGGALETRLAGVVVAALKEAFDRDHQRLELEREQIEAERRRVERALQLELRRQAADREIGRLRLIAGLAVASWLGTLFFAASVLEASATARAALGVGWLLLLGSLGASFAAQASVARSAAFASDGAVSSIGTGGAAAAAAPWLIVAGLAAVGFGVLLA
jgi:hypothetical protein